MSFPIPRTPAAGHPPRAPLRRAAAMRDASTASRAGGGSLRKLVCLTALLAAGCSKFDVLNATVPARGYLRTADVPYGPGSRQTLDVYRPRDATPDAPVVIFFYGGNWRTGDKGDYRFVAQALVSRGFIAVIPDYRLYPEVTFPAFVADGAGAVRWVHDHAASIGADRARVFLMGHSAGAHIAALLTLDPRYLDRVGLGRDAIRATVGLAGPYDFEPGPSDRAVFSMTRAQVRPAADAEPIECVDGLAPPMFLVQGLDDRVVDPRNATRLARRIRASGGDAKVATYRRTGHAAIVVSLARSFRFIAPTLHDVTAYFRSFDRPPLRNRTD